MSETRKLLLGAGSRIANGGVLGRMIDSALEKGSTALTSLNDSTIGVSLDNRGDWTISIGLSLKSDRFRWMSSGLERLGFFQATENEGTGYFLWTSFLTQSIDSRNATEQVLAEAVKILQATAVSQYIS